MSILSWLKNVVAGQAHAPMQFADDEQHFHGLDMKAAIDAHIAWKTRLESQIRGNATETLEVGVVASDCHCTLGKWIHGEGKEMFGQQAEYDQLRQSHAEFHLCAGGILADAHRGDREGAENSLRTCLRDYSDQVQLALVRLYARAANTQLH